MAGGWGNHIMQDEPSFLVLDSSLVLITCSLLTIFHPGIYFPRMCKGGKSEKAAVDGDQTPVNNVIMTEERKETPGDSSDSNDGHAKSQKV